MFHLSDSCLENCVALIISIVTLTFLYFKYSYSYWSRRNVISYPHKAPFGNFGPFIRLKQSLGDNIMFLYNKLKHEAKFAGVYLFTTPTLIITDPELCKIVLSRDFQYFGSRSTSSDEKNDPLTGTLPNLNGDR